MSEQLPQSHPEKTPPKQYLIPALGRVVLGTVNFNKQRIDVSRRAEGSNMMITHVEASYEDSNEEGDPVMVTKMVSDHHFTEIGQRNLQEQYEKANQPDMERKSGE